MRFVAVRPYSFPKNMHNSCNAFFGKLVHVWCFSMLQGSFSIKFRNWPVTKTIENYKDYFFHLPSLQPYFALLPSSSSILNNWLYLAFLSERAGAPVFIWPALTPTTKPAIKLSSVSPLLWLTTAVHLLSKAILIAFNVSVIVPIWFSFIRTEFAALSSIPFCILFVFVANKSSPTICIFLPSFFTISCHDCQSSSAKPSSMLTIGYVFTKSA